jgi:acetyl esterase/lipase
MTTVTYKTVAGHEILADVHSSKTEKSAILFIHGGALIFGNRMWISPDQLERYADAGLTVVSIDYRLAPETKLPEIVTDIEDAYAWMRTEGSARFGFDPDRIGVVGGSAGGYLTLLAGARFRPLPRALVSFYGYGDLTGSWYSQPSSFYNQMAPIAEQKARAAVGNGTISEGPMDPSSGRSDFYLYCRQQGIWPDEISGQHPSERDWFEPFEPLRNVSASYPPTLLLHGEADTDVPFEQSVLMAEQLARHGVVHDFVSDPEWGHAFDFLGASDPKVQSAFDQALAFLVDRL